MDYGLFIIPNNTKIQTIYAGRTTGIFTTFIDYLLWNAFHWNVDLFQTPPTIITTYFRLYLKMWMQRFPWMRWMLFLIRLAIYWWCDSGYQMLHYSYLFLPCKYVPWCLVRICRKRWWAVHVPWWFWAFFVQQWCSRPSIKVKDVVQPGWSE